MGFAQATSVIMDSQSLLDDELSVRTPPKSQEDRREHSLCGMADVHFINHGFCQYESLLKAARLHEAMSLENRGL